MDESQIIKTLSYYKSQAKNARESGTNPRDETWKHNWDIYWGRYNFSNKAPWQSKHVMPEATQAVDRWSAAMREALTQGADWFDPEIPNDEGDLAIHVRKLMDYILSRCGRSPEGHVLDFSAVFEEQMKMACIMMTNAVVTWKGFVSVETSDPRLCWFDPKRRGLYRFRRFEWDKYQVLELADLEDAEGNPLYNREAINQLMAYHDEQIREAQESASGHNSGDDRNTIVIDEWLATILDDDGKSESEKSLIMVANDKFIIRGPEPNPFWHQQDWVVSTPIIHVPLSIYGKSYMEDWVSVSNAFTDMTNLLLDSTFTSSMNAFAAQPDMLEDPTEIMEGVHPGKVFQLAQGMQTADFIRKIELGNMPAEAVTIWQALKQELREGQRLSEIALGQIPQKGGITATEISESSQSSSAVMRSVAKTVEERFLEPVLQLMFMTAMQHMDFTGEVRRFIGDEAADMFQGRREEFKTVHFRVRGISGIIERNAKLRNFLSMMQTIGQNELMLQQFLEKYDIGKAFDKLMKLFGVDTTELTLTQREQAMAAVTQPLNIEVPDEAG